MPAPARVVGQVTDTKTLEKIQRWKRENDLILAEFGTLKNFTNFLRSSGMTREEWVRQSFCSFAVEDALNLLLNNLLPRGKVRCSGLDR